MLGMTGIIGLKRSTCGLSRTWHGSCLDTLAARQDYREMFEGVLAGRRRKYTSLLGDTL